MCGVNDSNMSQANQPTAQGVHTHHWRQLLVLEEDKGRG